MELKPHENVVIKLEGYHPLDKEMDESFKNLYTSFFSSYLRNPPASLPELTDKYLPEFEDSVIRYLERVPSESPYYDKLINNLTPIWNRYLEDGRLKDAQQFWMLILNLVQRCETQLNKRIHKGSVYYYWGGTAVLGGELDKGYFLMHAAYQEDIESHQKAEPNTPAFMFVSLDFDDPNQYFHPLQKAHANYLDNFVQFYIQLRKRHFTKEDFQTAFLSAHPNRDTVFLFAHTLARLFHASFIPKPATNNNFASLLELNILFDLVLVIDSSIQAKSNVGWEFFNLAIFLSNESKLDLTNERLGNVNDSRKEINGFSKTLHLLLDRQFKCSDGYNLTDIESDIAVAYLIRNYVAHNVTSEPVIWKRYDEILHACLNTLFLTAEALYM